MMPGQQQDRTGTAAAQLGVLPEMNSQEQPLSSDETSIMRAARENPAHFALIYDRYFPRIYAYCLRRTNSAMEAEDLTSQIFIRALKSLPGYRGGMVTAWLFRIARSTVSNHYRNRRESLPLDDTIETLSGHAPSVLDTVMKTEQASIILAKIRDLPDEDQELIALRIDAELTSEEIGKIVGKRAGAVRMKLHRIFKHLQKQLAEDVS